MGRLFGTDGVRGMANREVTAELARAGLVDVEVQPTHEVADGMSSAIVRARKP